MFIGNCNHDTPCSVLFSNPNSTTERVIAEWSTKCSPCEGDWYDSRRVQFIVLTISTMTNPPELHQNLRLFHYQFFAFLRTCYVYRHLQLEILPVFVWCPHLCRAFHDCYVVIHYFSQICSSGTLLFTSFTRNSYLETDFSAKCAKHPRSESSQSNPMGYNIIHYNGVKMDESESGSSLSAGFQHMFGHIVNKIEQDRQEEVEI